MKITFAICLLLLLVSNTKTTGTVLSQTWTVDNASSHDLGTVTLDYSGGSSQFDVKSYSNYPRTLPSAATAITISGQTVYAPNTGHVALSGGGKVKVSWPSSNLIFIEEDGEIQSPQM